MDVWDRKGWLPVAALVACLALVACAKRPPERIAFSESVRERYRLDDAELRRLQYYISDQIVLERAVAGGTRRVDRGRLIVRGGTTVHQVVVPLGTPGWIETPSFVGEEQGRHLVEVSFARGSPLRFTPREAGGVYVLAAPASATSGSFGSLFGGRARLREFDVPFAGDQWRVAAGASAHLLIETNALEKLESKRRVLEGLRGPD